MGFELLLGQESLLDINPEDYLHDRIKAFDIDFYRNFPHHNGKSDLVHLDDYALLKHFIKRAPQERRAYSRILHYFIDPVFYMQKYKDLNLKDHHDAIYHWMYFGAFQQKVPNCVTEEILTAKYHLFQMGKVGSKSVQAALHDAGISSLIPHIHFASDLVATYPDCFYSYPQVISLSQRIKFISGIREPLSRIFSGILQSLTEPTSSLDYPKIAEMIKNPDQLYDFIYNQSIVITDWFHHKYFSEIDVYHSDYDQKLGFSVIHGKSHDLFLYNQSRLDNLWDELSLFCSLPLKKKHENITSDKNDMISEIKYELNKIKIPNDLLSKIYATKYCQKFFSESEILTFQSKYLLSAYPQQE